MPGAEYAFDLDRILFGKLPWFYLVEILLRTAIIYTYALFVVRMLGKRGMGQLAPFDFVIIIALGSAVGDPMFYPDVPLMHAIVAITAIVLFTRGLTYLTQRNRKLQNFVSANASRLIRDGVMDLREMKREGVARAELFEGLRTEGIGQLGQVERAYLEPNGQISVFRQPHEAVRPGVPVLPEEEEDRVDFHEAGEPVLEPGRYGCWQCGAVEDLAIAGNFPECLHCEGRRWTKAVARVHDFFAGRRVVTGSSATTAR